MHHWVIDDSIKACRHWCRFCEPGPKSTNVQKINCTIKILRSEWSVKKFPRSVFQRVQLTVFQHWVSYWLGANWRHVIIWTNWDTVHGWIYTSQLVRFRSRSITQIKYEHRNHIIHIKIILDTHHSRVGNGVFFFAFKPDLCSTWVIVQLYAILGYTVRALHVVNQTKLVICLPVLNNCTICSSFGDIWRWKWLVRFPNIVLLIW